MKNYEVNKKPETEGGFIAIIIFFIIALALLKYYFNWSIFEASATPQGQETVSYTRHLIDVIWSFFAPITSWFWTNILSPIIHLIFTTLLSHS